MLRVLERIACAVEDQTQALLLVNQSNLQLLDELTAEPEPQGEQEDDTHYLDGTPKGQPS